MLIRLAERPGLLSLGVELILATPSGGECVPLSLEGVKPGFTMRFRPTGMKRYRDARPGDVIDGWEVLEMDGQDLEAAGQRVDSPE